MKPFPLGSEARLNIVLVEPQIPPNTGNIARLCAATKCRLILTGTLGFELSDKTLRRAGLDYWQFVDWIHYPDAESFFQQTLPQNRYLFTTKSQIPYTQAKPKHGDYLFFGKETAGLPTQWLEQYPQHSLTIPIWNPNIRSLNLASSVSIIAYDFLRSMLEF